MQVTYVQALARAIYESVQADRRVILLGAGFGGLSPAARQAFEPLHRDFADRVLEVPISELGIAGAGIGAALVGCRPLVDLSTGSFLFQAFPQVVNEAANVHYMTGGQSRAPVTFYSIAGIRGAGAAQHSHRTHAMLGNVPGLQIFLPASPADAYALMRWALLESQNPTVFLTHALLLAEQEEVDFGAPALPVGRARVRREGRDVTVVATSVMVPRSLQAAERLEREHGISAEVIDLRTLVPLDRQAVLASVARTGRLVVVDESHLSFGAGAELAAVVAEKGWRHLKAPVRRVATPDVPIPFSPALENELVVTPEKIAAAVVEAVRGGREAVA